MDEVLADALTEHLARCTTAFGRPFTADMARGRFMEAIVRAARSRSRASLVDASFFADPRRDARRGGRGPRADRSPRGVHRDRRDGRTDLVRREVPVAGAALSVHPDVAHRLLRRQEHHRRRRPDRRLTTALRALPGTAAFCSPRRTMWTKRATCGWTAGRMFALCTSVRPGTSNSRRVNESKGRKESRKSATGHQRVRIAL